MPTFQIAIVKKLEDKDQELSTRDVVFECRSTDEIGAWITEFFTGPPAITATVIVAITRDGEAGNQTGTTY